MVIRLCSRHLKGKGKGFWAQEKCEECTRKEGVIRTFTWLMFIRQSDKKALSPKKIVNVDLSLLKCTEFFHRFQK